MQGLTLPTAILNNMLNHVRADECPQRHEQSEKDGLFLP